MQHAPASGPMAPHQAPGALHSLYTLSVSQPHNDILSTNSPPPPAVCLPQVLLCLGRPYPSSYLRRQRLTYFLWDLASPWLALAVLGADVMMAGRAGSGSSGYSGALPAMGTAGGSSNAATSGLIEMAASGRGLASQQGVHCGAGGCLKDDGCYGAAAVGGLLRDGAAVGMLHGAAPAPAGATQPDASVLQQAASKAGSNSIDSAAPLGCEGAAVTAMAPGKPSDTASAAAAAWLAPGRMLVAAAGAHGLLHLYYIATWATKHTREVIDMSAAASMRQRVRQHGWARTAWFFAGTGYDIATHLLLSAGLLGSMRPLA